MSDRSFQRNYQANHCDYIDDNATNHTTMAGGIFLSGTVDDVNHRHCNRYWKKLRIYSTKRYIETPLIFVDFPRIVRKFCFGPQGRLVLVESSERAFEYDYHSLGVREYPDEE